LKYLGIVLQRKDIDLSAPQSENTASTISFRIASKKRVKCSLIKSRIATTQFHNMW